MKLNAIIVDDEPLARKLVANLLKSVHSIKVIGIYGTGKEAIREINALEPDILFLDIQLKDMTGFDVLERIRVTMPLTIFITAYDKYAIDAFNIFAFDYLLKPFTEERFFQSVTKCIENLNARSNHGLHENMAGLLRHVKTNEQENSALRSKIPVPLGNKTVFISKDDISHIRASNYYIEIYTVKSKYVLRNSMYNMMNELDSNLFARIHRSSIINLRFINELVNSAYGEIDVKMQNGETLRVSKGYRKEFLIKVGVKR